MLHAIQKMLVLLNYLDWVTPMLGLAKSLSRGRTYVFRIPWEYLDGLTDKDIVALLQSHGIEAWGRILRWDDLLIAVRAEDAFRAQDLLLEHGIPLRLVLPSREAGRTRHRRARVTSSF